MSFATALLAKYKVEGDEGPKEMDFDLAIDEIVKALKKTDDGDFIANTYSGVVKEAFYDKARKLIVEK